MSAPVSLQPAFLQIEPQLYRKQSEVPGVEARAGLTHKFRRDLRKEFCLWQTTWESQRRPFPAIYRPTAGLRAR